MILTKIIIKEKWSIDTFWIHMMNMWYILFNLRNFKIGTFLTDIFTVLIFLEDMKDKLNYYDNNYLIISWNNQLIISNEISTYLSVKYKIYC